MIVTTKQIKGGRLAVLADGAEMFVCEPSFWYSLGICEEDEIDEARLEEIRAENERRRCCAAAYKYLSARAYSERNVRLKLAKNFPPEAIDYAVARAKELSLIDDEGLAELLASQLLEQRHYAPPRITAELQKRGIPRAEAEAAVDALEFDAHAQIELLFETKFKNSLGDAKGVRRAAAALSRMGYSWGDIKTATEALTDEEVFYDE